MVAQRCTSRLIAVEWWWLSLTHFFLVMSENFAVNHILPTTKFFGLHSCWSVVSNDTNFLFFTPYQQRFVCCMLNYDKLLKSRIEGGKLFEISAISLNELHLSGTVCHLPSLILEVCHPSRELSITPIRIYLHDIDVLCGFITCTINLLICIACAFL